MFDKLNINFSVMSVYLRTDTISHCCFRNANANRMKPNQTKSNKTQLIIS